jgi:hypothetical protein
VNGGAFADRQKDVCQCPPAFSSQQENVLTFRQTDEHIRTAREAGSQSGQAFFDSSLSSTEDDVDDYGRTVGGGDQDNNEVKGGNKQESATAFSGPQVQLPPLHQHVPPSSQPSGGSADVSDSLTLSARSQTDSKTDKAKAAIGNLQHTSESLERVVPSPSSGSYNEDGLTASVSRMRSHTPPLVPREDSESDFYLGSLPGLQAGEDGDLNVIVTKAENTLRFDDSLYPHGVSVPPGDEMLENDEEWEYYEEEEGEEREDEEEKPHPAFGKVDLQWLNSEKKETLYAQPSSVRCTGTMNSDRLCHFHNLCFDPLSRKFVFLQGSNSVKENVNDEQLSLLELSSVAGHNAQYFSYSVHQSSVVRNFQIATVPGTTVVFRRFKPDNIMHVFHDDVIPLLHFLTDKLALQPTNQHGSDPTLKFPVSLFLADENSEGEFYDLYTAFSAGGTFTQESLAASVAKTTDSPSLVCFPDAYVGLPKTTTWYQYGFFEPQGPIPRSSVSSSHVHSAGSYLMNTLTLECPLCGEGGHFVLISRRETRRILNEMDLVLGISRRFKVDKFIIIIIIQGLICAVSPQV